ncbi:MAG: peptidoglycan-associated lipoprotein Pal [Gammaproteobacteria bacterium]|nr:peptidoglycan-associated lipoprotein Pal [Gammaproteobacteria bacterium]
MRAIWKPVLLAFAVAAVSGCSSMGKKSTTDAGAAGAGSDGATTPMEGMGSDTFQGMSINDPSSPLAQRVIYFELDSSQVREADRAVLANHAAYLKENPQAVITLEGHGDERGSPEYNIALGERRAQAVRQMMEFSGATAQQLPTVSYGEEKPAVEGHDESAWSQNRRVELVYPGR